MDNNPASHHLDAYKNIPSSDLGGDPADAAARTTEIEDAARDAEILGRTYAGEAHGPRCRCCMFPLHDILDPDHTGYCSNTCRRRAEED